ncbi:MAG TPA: hypothetical protein VGB75_04345 [Jatrophihabitans sp.]|jgi:hypothetical protein|uniref:hypothetical protein n=1 Tax=Jatrophihabitans sp. TaxID=1932789 RepID=UPI002EE0181E
MRWAARAAAVATALILVAGCESESEKEKEKEREAAAAGAAVCLKDAKAAQLPDGFPTNFPLPAGTIVTSAENRGDAGLVIEGVTNTAFKDVLKGLQDDLPAKGFTLKNGETEPHDAESDWTSAEFDGRWAIREMSQCAGETSVSVVARKK